MQGFRHLTVALAAAVLAGQPSRAFAQEHHHEHPMVQQRDQVRAQLVAVQAMWQRVEAAIKRSQGLTRELLGRLPGATDSAPPDAGAGLRALPADLAAAASQLKGLTDRTRSIIRDESKPPERTRPSDAEAAPRASLTALEERNRSIRRLQSDVETFAAGVRTLLDRTRALLANHAPPLDTNTQASGERLQRQIGVIVAEADQARRALESLAKSLGLPGS